MSHTNQYIYTTGCNTTSGFTPDTVHHVLPDGEWHITSQPYMRNDMYNVNVNIGTQDIEEKETENMYAVYNIHVIKGTEIVGTYDVVAVSQEDAIRKMIFYTCNAEKVDYDYDEVNFVLNSKSNIFEPKVEE